MAAYPNIAQRYGGGRHGRDVILGSRPWQIGGRHGFVRALQVAEEICRWLTRNTPAVWSSGSAAVEFVSRAAQAPFRAAASGGTFASRSSGGWRREKDC